MPTTITAFNVFTPGTKARSNEVNENFNNYRGDLLPINSTTATASDMSHDLGSDSHRWRFGYLGTVDLKSSTSTASLQITGDTSSTAGAMLFKIGGNTVAQIKSTGMPASSISPNEILIWTTYTVASLGTNGATLVIPTNGSVEFIYPFGCGTGGGGGAGAGYTTGSATSGGGGGGGGSVPYFSGPLKVTPGETLSITVGQVGVFGAGGSGTTTASNGASGTPGQACTIQRAGVTIWNSGAGSGGGGGVIGTGAGVGAGGTGGVAYFGFMVTDGGDGGAGDSDGGFGAASPWASVGLFGVSGPGAGGGGGGGGAGYGRGGQGGNGGAGGAGSNGATATGYGAGGGGGGASDAAGSKGGNGGDGGPAILMIGYIR